MEEICMRCKKKITELKDFGSYSPEYGATLCKDCSVAWIEMRNNHHKIEEDYIRGRDLQEGNGWTKH